MKKCIFTILLLITSNVVADPTLSGLWEGYKKMGPSYGSQILEIKENGKGFYAYSVGENHDKKLVFPINITKLKFKNGYMEIILRKGELNHTLIISEGLANELEVLTILTSKDNKPQFSISWTLTKVRKNIRNLSLYNYAKNAL